MCPGGQEYTIACTYYSILSLSLVCEVHYSTVCTYSVYIRMYGCTVCMVYMYNVCTVRMYSMYNVYVRILYVHTYVCMYGVLYTLVLQSPSLVVVLYQTQTIHCHCDVTQCHYCKMDCKRVGSSSQYYCRCEHEHACVRVHVLYVGVCVCPPALSTSAACLGI